MSIRLYAGLKRNGIWFRNAEVNLIKGGGLAALDGPDKSGGARLLNLLKKTVFKFYSETGEEYPLTDQDYMHIYVMDTWKLAREAMKLINGKDEFIFSEFFWCPVCSTLDHAKYTEVNEDWDSLIADGLMDEIYLEDDQEPFYYTDLPVGAIIPSSKTMAGGTFTRIKREHLTLGKMIKLQKNKWASESEANMIFAAWDASIVEIEGMSDREFNLNVKMNPMKSFCKQYLISQEDQDAMYDSENQNLIGLDSSMRSVTCKHCFSEIGGLVDFSNFFQFLLPKSSVRKGFHN